jgi:hypothetical protein
MSQRPHPCPNHECDRDSIKLDFSRLHLYHLTLSLAISFSPPLREPTIPFHGRIFSFAILFSPTTRETGVPFHRRNFSFGFDFSPCILETLRAVLSRLYLNGFGVSFDVSWVGRARRECLNSADGENGGSENSFDLHFRCWIAEFSGTWTEFGWLIGRGFGAVLS